MPSEWELLFERPFGDGVPLSGAITRSAINRQHNHLAISVFELVGFKNSDHQLLGRHAEPLSVPFQLIEKYGRNLDSDAAELFGSRQKRLQRNSAFLERSIGQSRITLGDTVRQPAFLIWRKPVIVIDWPGFPLHGVDVRDQLTQGLSSAPHRPCAWSPRRAPRVASQASRGPRSGSGLAR